MKKKITNKWEEKLGYNFDDEFKKFFSIYSEQELIEGVWKMLVKKLKFLGKSQKIQKERFDTYASWESYILGKYSDYDEETLLEFQHFLEFKEGTGQIANKLLLTLIIPFVTAVLGSVISGLIPYGESWKGIIINMSVLIICYTFALRILFVNLINAGLEFGRCEMFFRDYRKIIERICENKCELNKDLSLKPICESMEEDQILDVML